MQKAVFLDRDGVINEIRADKEFYYRKEDIKIIPNVPEAIKILKDAGFVIICITNQPIIARGVVSVDEVEKLNEQINVSIGGLIDEIYLCPHHPEMHPDVPEHAKKYRIACGCRKPLTGMVLTAAKKYDIDLKNSWFLGDTITDVICGKKSGCKTIQVLSLFSPKKIKSSTQYDVNTKADFEVDNLMEAVEIILNED